MHAKYGQEAIYTTFVCMYSSNHVFPTSNTENKVIIVSIMITFLIIGCYQSCPTLPFKIMFRIWFCFLFCVLNKKMQFNIIIFLIFYYYYLGYNYFRHPSLMCDANWPSLCYKQCD